MEAGGYREVEGDVVGVGSGFGEVPVVAVFTVNAACWLRDICLGWISAFVAGPVCPCWLEWGREELDDEPRRLVLSMFGAIPDIVASLKLQIIYKVVFVLYVLEDGRQKFGRPWIGVIPLWAEMHVR